MLKSFLSNTVIFVTFVSVVFGIKSNYEIKTRLFMFACQGNEYRSIGVVSSAFKQDSRTSKLKFLCKLLVTTIL